MPDPSKVILITGCSSGFGFLAAARLAGRGHRVYATMRDMSRAHFLEAEAKCRAGEKNLRVLPLDVTKPRTIKTAVAEIAADAGKIDVLVNNAGFGMGGFFEDLSAEDWEKQFSVNFFGVVNVTREVLPLMRPRKKGVIINISSLAAFSGTPAFSAYCSSKWALEGFSECLYMELRQFRIHVCLIEPCSYRTRIFDDNARYAENFNNPQSPYFSQSQRLRMLVNDHLRNNHRNPEEVAAAVEDVMNNPLPPFRTVIGFRSNLRRWIVRHIPFKLYAWLVRKVLFKGL